MRIIKAGILIPCLLLCLFMAGLPSRAAETVISVRTKEEFEAIREAPAASYRLESDIDMRGVHTPFAFSGTLDGNGHTLYNLSVTGTGAEIRETLDGNRKARDTRFAGLFSCLEGGTVKDLSLAGAFVNTEETADVFVAMLAGYAKDAEITGCSVSGRARLLSAGGLTIGAGGLCGYMDSCTVKDCTVDAELVLNDTDKTAVSEEFTGGLFASGRGRISACTVRTRTYASVNGYAHNGGLAGMAFWVHPGDDYKQRISGCVSDTEIVFREHAPSRRAYSAAFIGENLGHNCYVGSCKEKHFVSTEMRNAEAPLLPETCETPAYADTVTPPGCETWGFTARTCRGCGYGYRCDYTPPRHEYAPVSVEPPSCTEPGRTVYRCAFCESGYSEPLPAAGHTPGETVVARAPGYYREGLAVTYCATCQKALYTTVLAPPDPPELMILLDCAPVSRELACRAGGLLRLSATMEGVSWISSAPETAEANENGTVTLKKRGTAVIACSDGHRTVSVRVRVK